MTKKQIVDMLAGPHAVTRACPSCQQGTLELVDATIVEPWVLGGVQLRDGKVATKEREVLAASCNQCEFMEEVRF